MRRNKHSGRGAFLPKTQRFFQQIDFLEVGLLFVWLIEDIVILFGKPDASKAKRAVGAIRAMDQVGATAAVFTLNAIGAMVAVPAIIRMAYV
jgi:hypothetical protein